MFQEVDEVVCDLSGCVVWRMVGLGVVRIIGFHDGDYTLWIDRNVRCSDTVLRCHDEIWLSSRR